LQTISPQSITIEELDRFFEKKINYNIATAQLGPGTRFIPDMSTVEVTQVTANDLVGKRYAFTYSKRGKALALRIVMIPKETLLYTFTMVSAVDRTDNLRAFDALVASMTVDNPQSGKSASAKAPTRKKHRTIRSR
jgi:hypothetical protein